jgi:hypothetical protein
MIAPESRQNLDGVGVATLRQRARRLELHVLVKGIEESADERHSAFGRYAEQGRAALPEHVWFRIPHEQFQSERQGPLRSAELRDGSGAVDATTLSASARQSVRCVKMSTASSGHSVRARAHLPCSVAAESAYPPQAGLSYTCAIPRKYTCSRDSPGRSGL